jgi:hypothetical protein
MARNTPRNLAKKLKEKHTLANQQCDGNKNRPKKVCTPQKIQEMKQMAMLQSTLPPFVPRESAKKNTLSI